MRITFRCTLAVITGAVVWTGGGWPSSTPERSGSVAHADDDRPVSRQTVTVRDVDGLRRYSSMDNMDVVLSEGNYVLDKRRGGLRLGRNTGLRSSLRHVLGPDLVPSGTTTGGARIVASHLEPAGFDDYVILTQGDSTLSGFALVSDSEPSWEGVFGDRIGIGAAPGGSTVIEDVLVQSLGIGISTIGATSGSSTRLTVRRTALLACSAQSIGASMRGGAFGIPVRGASMNVTVERCLIGNATGNTMYVVAGATDWDATIDCDFVYRSIDNVVTMNDITGWGYIVGLSGGQRNRAHIEIRGGRVEGYPDLAEAGIMLGADWQPESGVPEPRTVDNHADVRIDGVTFANFQRAVAWNFPLPVDVEDGDNEVVLTMENCSYGDELGGEGLLLDVFESSFGVTSPDNRLVINGSEEQFHRRNSGFNTVGFPDFDPKVSNNFEKR